jgi:hypothetical protein
MTPRPIHPVRLPIFSQPIEIRSRLFQLRSVLRPLAACSLFATLSGSLLAAETPANQPAKPGFFSRMVRSSEKSAEKSAPSEAPAPSTKKSPPAHSIPSGSPSASSSAPRQTSSVTDSKTARKGGTKKPTDAKNEDELFYSARMRALEDPTIGELRSKADKARDKESGIAATKTYLKGLYGKMRDLEPGLKERIDLTETAALQSLTKSP